MSTTPTHGKLGALYMLRPNGFKGSGLNDITWGTGYNGVASGYFEVVIDAEAAPDTFKWRKNGGGWTTGVAITGGAQTLSDAQTITFAATTGHTLTDQWTIGNLAAEGCDESGTTGQITDATKRILNPNAPPAFTDSGGQLVTAIDYGLGKAYFDGNVTIVTVAGNNGFLVASGLQQVGYLLNWSLNISLDMADISAMGDVWKTAIPALGGGNGSAEAYFIGGKAFFETLKNFANQKYYFLQLFSWDLDQDQTGDQLRAWATLSGIGENCPIGEVVKERLSFGLQGIPSFVADS